MLNVRRRFKGNRKVTLVLTPLLDMFTIILVFLMVSFQAEDKDFVLNSDVKLPISGAQSPFKTAVNLAITHDAVLVEGRNVYSLGPGGNVEPEEVARGGIDAVTQAVADAWENRKKETDEENVVVVQADKHLPYRTVYLVARSAAQSGFFRYRLVVEKE